jgi:hypothetical protein
MISSRNWADRGAEKFIPWRRFFMVEVAVVGVAGGEEGPAKLKLGVACCVAIVCIQVKWSGFDLYAGLKASVADEDISKREKEDEENGRS